MSIYLDNGATTAICPEAIQAALHIMTDVYGNPSSLHQMGIESERELTAATQAVAEWMGVDRSEIIFTSGGTEANNLAIFGAAQARKRRGRHIVTSSIEHPSVARAIDRLEEEGFEITRIAPDQSGSVSPDAVVKACRPDTVLISIMSVNNETGAVFPFDKTVPLLRKAAPQAFLHTDAVAAAGKQRIYRPSADAVTVSGHKLHAPKGIGLLYLRKGVRILPQLLGGGQSNGLRSGTEPLPGIAALAAAVRALPDVSVQQALYEKLRKRIVDQLSPEGVRFFLPEGGAPYVLNLSVPGCRSEVLVRFLSMRDISVSGGSACAKGKKSEVLTACGLDNAYMLGALRVTFGYDNTEQDADAFVHAIREARSSLKTK